MASPSKGRTLKALLQDVQRETGGQPQQWVGLHDVASRIGADDGMVEAAVRVAVDRGLLLAEGEPPYRICLQTGQMQELS
jgi:hypothetical protein